MDDRQNKEPEQSVTKHESDATRCLRALLIALDLDPMDVEAETEEIPCMRRKDGA
jgi:hypothetical protein